MKKYENLGLATIIIIIVVLLTLGIFSQSNVPTEGVKQTYYCNYNVLSLNTNIKTTNSTGKNVTISGNILTWLEDPLSMKDENGNVLMYAGDAYNFITQNDHGIYINEQHIYDVVGEFKVFADKYTIRDTQGNNVAYVNFNTWDTIGKMYTIDGTLVAQYNSGYFNKDYTVSIFKENTFNEDAIQMIFASYVSDKEADN